MQTASVLRIFDSPEDIDLSGLPKEFVVKPTLQSSTKGVMVLKRTESVYWDSLRRRDLTIELIRSEQAILFEATNSPDNKIIVEEKINDVAGLIPRDYKAYAFGGEIALILEIDRNTTPSSAAWFDHRFEPITDQRVVTNPKYVSERKGNRPDSWRSLLNLAAFVSAGLPTAFASIDMYCTENGPVIGEITLAPGGLYYGEHFQLSDDEDLRWGRLWDETVRLRSAEE